MRWFHIKQSEISYQQSTLQTISRSLTLSMILGNSQPALQLLLSPQPQPYQAKAVFVWPRLPGDSKQQKLLRLIFSLPRKLQPLHPMNKQDTSNGALKSLTWAALAPKEVGSQNPFQTHFPSVFFFEGDLANCLRNIFSVVIITSAVSFGCSRAAQICNMTELNLGPAWHL